MKLIIDIPEDRYKDIQRIASVQLEKYHFQTAEQIIANGTPLPKGHGRLIDADEFEELFAKMCPSDCGACDPKRKTDGRGRWYDTCSLIDVAPTVIEADTESEEGKTW